MRWCVFHQDVFVIQDRTQVLLLNTQTGHVTEPSKQRFDVDKLDEIQ